MIYKYFALQFWKDHVVFHNACYKWPQTHCTCRDVPRH